jgi:cytochrome c oxidase assembly protein subunit 15
MEKTSKKIIVIWLITGIIMIWGQIIIGGITRLTDSGLTITEWNIIKGTIPPTNETEWIEAFEKYKVSAAKQYQSIHASISIDHFKIIYFWEYFHRLWARLMGFVFIFPFAFFYFKGYFTTRLLRQLGVVILLASLSAIFGWIMVASGLNDDTRTWVNAYNLLIHLILASSLFSFLSYVIYSYSLKSHEGTINISFRKSILILLGLFFIQLCLGALMSGMRAGLIFPYPFTILRTDLFVPLVSQIGSLTVADISNYEPNAAIKVLVQIAHRMTAYLILGYCIYLYIKSKKTPVFRQKFVWFILLILIQMTLGIITVSLCVGKVPVLWGVVHQAFAFVALSYLIYLIHCSSTSHN